MAALSDSLSTDAGHKVSAGTLRSSLAMGSPDLAAEKSSDTLALNADMVSSVDKGSDSNSSCDRQSKHFVSRQCAPHGSLIMVLKAVPLGVRHSSTKSGANAGDAGLRCNCS